MEEADDTSCSLKFPIHHKARREERTTSANKTNISFVPTEDIEKIIIKAYRKAEVIMDILQLTEILKKNDLNDLQKLNAFVFRQLTAKSTRDYSYFNEDDLYDSSDTNNTHVELIDELVDANFEGEENCLDEYNPYDYDLVCSKDTFHGMRIFDKINPTKKSHYFQITINNNLEFIHKQTAARLLTLNKNSLSSDRLSRVQATHKQH